MAYGFNGSIVKIAKQQEMTIASSIDMPTAQIEYEEYYYNPNSMSYTKIENPHEIERLKKELVQQKEEKKRKLQNIIGYYYKR